mgnify:CR=1 FL=1
MTKLTEHFTREELSCKCCGRMEFPVYFLEALETLRRAFGAPMAITSGYRCPAHNQAVSTTGEAGPHTLGAVDVAVQGPDGHKLVLLAMNLGWTGIGVSQRQGQARFIHLDRLAVNTYPRPRIWSY